MQTKYEVHIRIAEDLWKPIRYSTGEAPLRFDTDPAAKAFASPVYRDRIWGVDIKVVAVEIVP